MKPITKLFIALLIVFGMNANAQISLLQTYPGNGQCNLQPVYLKHAGFKLVLIHSDSLTFYNMNLSLYENAIIPGGAWGQVRFIAQGLFDTDTLHLDYLVENIDSVVVYKDNGNVVFRKDSASFTGEFPGYAGPSYFPIFGTDSGTFMILSGHPSYAIYTNQLYKLPGSLPCVPGCFEDYFTSVSPINNTMNGEMKVYPNPAVSYTNIYYTLPPGTNEGEINLFDLAGRELKKYTVTPQFDHIRLTTSDIAAGTYFYQLVVNGNGIATKKIVVVK